MEEIIRVENLTFEYSTDESLIATKALDNVSFSIEKGSFTAIIGRNGSGKSTLAKHLNALLLPVEGRVLVGGIDTADSSKLWNIRQRVGMVFQNPDNQLVSAIVEDDVAFGPENLGIEPAQIRERVDAALDAVNMYAHRKKAPHLLSGGQKQRIAIAGVIAMEPECIVFDEPTAMLDPSGRKAVMDIIEKLHDKGITVILITHFMDEAAKADRIIIMDKGRIALDGTPQEIFLNADKVRELNLELPLGADIADRLRKAGIDVPQNIIEAEEMVEFLCRLK
ncbi:MAG: energy-coupling factor transporter ATPase [Clostridia bacterium]|nr:energy-coupling factor transporter ATPase [Clostridia bacterium]